MFYTGSTAKCNEEEEEEEEDSPSACIPFVLPAELQADEVTSAELWIYQTNSGDDFVVSEISHSRSRRDSNTRGKMILFSLSVLIVQCCLQNNSLIKCVHKSGVNKLVLKITL